MQKIKNLSKKIKLAKCIVNNPKLIASNQHYSRVNIEIQQQNRQTVLEQSINNISKDNPNFRFSCANYIAQKSTISSKPNKNQQNLKLQAKKAKRYFTDQSESFKQQSNQLKIYFDSVAKKTNQIHKKIFKDRRKVQRDTKKEHQKFMNQLSLTDIDIKKIQSQKLLFKKIQGQIGCIPSKISGNRISLQALQENHNTILICLKLIDKAYTYMNDLQSLGYAKKSNKYVISYCTLNRPWLSEVFLYESRDKKGCFSENFKYYVVSTANQAKANFTRFISRNKSKDIKFIQSNFQEFTEYVQKLFINKKQLQLNQVSQYLEYRLSDVRKFNENEDGMRFEYSNLRIQAIEEDKINFTDQIIDIQQKYGTLKEISKVSRKRYQALNQTYNKLNDLM